MTSVPGWDHVLEVLNGVGVIASGWLLAFLILHLYRTMTWQHRWHSLSRLPQGIQMAIALTVITFGIFVSSTIVWARRLTNDGIFIFGKVDPMFFVGARFTLFAGLLYALRVVTRPLIGNWPWVGAIATSAVYLAWSIFRYSY